MEAPITQRQIVLNAMQQRPADPWPRWQGHVVLGTPGSPRTQKAYHEPGGAFSPSPGSFGVSIAFAHPGKPRLSTGDELPLSDIQQQYTWSAPAGVPAIETTTPQYSCRWSLSGDNLWTCDLSRPANAGNLTLLLRSVGPAGGPIDRLDWDGRQLIINHRWVLTFDPAPSAVHLVSEQSPNWLTAPGTTPTLNAPDGWGAARIEFPSAQTRLTIRDTAPIFASPLAYSQVKSGLDLDLPDPAFTASLQAQAANLLMGFIGRQTCPGEPTNYPLAWERDGAYSVVAMARAGQIETAKQLAVYFAENDFFGGFGAEGDAPGSAINVLATVALISGDAAFQKWCWPHIQRKLALIEEMYCARDIVRKTWIGPIVPEHQGKEMLPVICQAARDGLIMGNMDLHFPALYINAMSYRGLRQAIRLAEAIGLQQEVSHLPAMADRLQATWQSNLHTSEYANERTYMTGLWPTWITSPSYEPYRQGLQERWDKEHHDGTYPVRPLWTYFTVAEAHQWLFVDRPDNTWKTLRYFWANQCSPGLYTYWEGEKEENTFGLWPHIRGWVAPKHVTPHYWTAAEMLLLQVDMLAYVAEAGPEPTLVIAAGAPESWKGKPMHAKGLPTLLGTVDWTYDGKEFHVTLYAKRPCPVRAGVAFGPNVRINVQHRPV